MNNLKYFIILFFGLMPYLALCQINGDSILHVEEVVVEVNRFKNYSIGNKVQVIDSSVLQDYRANSLADLLTQQSPIFVKSYGLNNLASVSVRGTGASHTSILWNGFSIQSPTLGQSDFSLIPVNNIDELYIQYGGGGALYGSGSIGATIHMINSPKFNKGIKASISNSFSSFSDNYQSLSFSISKRRVISSVKFFNHFSKNNYLYLNEREKKRWNDATLKQYGILQENFILISDKQQLNFRIWYQNNDRDIPPSNEALNKTNLTNGFLRLTSEWKSIGQKQSLYVRQAYFNEYTNYTDTSSFITRFQTSISEIENKLFIRSNQSLNIGVNNTYNYVTSDKLGGNHQQNRLALFVSYKIRNAKDNIRLVSSLRKEFVNGFSIPFAPSIGFEGVVRKWLLLKSSVSRTYRVPSFNDLYWTPGGNPNLKPENGWSEEIGVITSLFHRSFTATNELTFFNSNVNNWIIWLPADAVNWTPQNLQYVWARGLEETFKLSKNIRKVKVGLTASYSYVLSTNEKVKMQGDKSLHKQLIYVPIYSGYGNVSFAYKTFAVVYNQTFTGNRFTSSDNSYYIKGYVLGNLILSNTFKWSEYTVSVLFKVNNIWNADYKVIPNAPMPLRYFQVSVSLLYK